MDNSTQTLVIFLSVTLAVFLVLSIVLVSYLISIAMQVRRIIDSAERTVTTVEEVASSIQKTVAPAVASQFMLNQFKRLVDIFGEKKQTKNKDEQERGK
ncbi:MAG TPA: hypothetical protein VNX65_01310 [Patescibacteria group bacterium]|jgi:hypothetical protein|nr:hypothetical protein [Patescibacteria group bacterium]